MRHTKSNNCRIPQNRQPFEQFFNEFLGGLDTVFGKDMNTTPTGMVRANIMEDDAAFHIELVAPGRNKEDFSIKLDGDTLSVSAENKEESKEDNSKYHRREFRHSSLKREFSLPKHADREAISAKYENGILLISIPKVAKKDSTKQIDIL